MVEARGGRAILVGLLAPAGDCYQGDGALAAQFANAPRDLVTGKARHADVEDRDVGLLANKQRDCFEAVVRHVHLVAIEPQQHGERFAGVAIVVGHENAPQSGGGDLGLKVSGIRGWHRVGD
jgi:hypothetical protein